MSRGIRSSPRPTRLRNAFARSWVSHCDRLVTSVVCSECSTTRPSTSRPRTCLPSYATTTGNSRLTCARRTTSAMRRETWRPPVCLRSGSTRPSGVPGFCSKLAVGRRRVAEDAFDPQERYDIFMNNYTERTWTLVTISEEVSKLHVWSRVLMVHSSPWNGRVRGQILHGSARTTAAVRRAIQHSQESLRVL